MDTKAQLRAILDQLAAQLAGRGTRPTWYGGPAAVLDARQIGELASVARDLAAAEREWHQIPDQPS